MELFPNPRFKRGAMELAGEIAEVNHAEDFKPTYQVFGFLSYVLIHPFRKKGVLVHYAVIPSQYLAHGAGSLTPRQTPGISPVGVTAYHAMREPVDSQLGQAVFVNA